MSIANTAEPAFETVDTIAALRSRVDRWKQDGMKIGFVPTMGALHEGHLSLVSRANALADRTIASIFVNPRQFAAHEDLDSYPRPESRDIALLQAAGCHLAFLPAASEMYPAGFETSVTVSALGSGLCGVSRPHFFGGVATVVCKLLNQVRPTFAVFGEKDFQQLLVIRRMVRDLDMDVEIVGAPIVREADGLAMSSRNAYLTGSERILAGRLNPIIAAMAKSLSEGAPVETCRDKGFKALAAASLTDVDYLDVRCERNLSSFGEGPIDRPARVFVAVRIGMTRLIDNWRALPHGTLSAPAD